MNYLAHELDVLDEHYALNAVAVVSSVLEMIDLVAAVSMELFRIIGKNESVCY